MCDIADGQDHHLDPRVIPLEQATGAILLAVIAFWSFAGLLVGALAGGSLTVPARIGPLLLWAVLIGLGAWHALRWPARVYARTFYRVDGQGIEIRRGWASGQMGFIIWKWYKTAIRRLPRESLNKGVWITEIATTPAKKGANDQPLRAVPLIRKEGICHVAQIMPRINPAQNGANLRCSKGRASPRQPNSSIGPNLFVVIKQKLRLPGKQVEAVTNAAASAFCVMIYGNVRSFV